MVSVLVHESAEMPSRDFIGVFVSHDTSEPNDFLVQDTEAGTRIFPCRTSWSRTFRCGLCCTDLSVHRYFSALTFRYKHLRVQTLVSLVKQICIWALQYLETSGSVMRYFARYICHRVVDTFSRY